MKKVICEIKRISRRNAFFMISLQRILVLMRSEITNEAYHTFLKTAIRCISQEPSNDYKRYILLKRQLDKNIELIQYVEEKKYILKKDKRVSSCNNWEIVNKYITFIESQVNEVLALIQQKKFEQSYDLIDWLHALPEAILLKQKWDVSVFEDNYVIPYDAKWNTVTNIFLL